MLLSQKHLRCLGSRLVGYPRGERAAFERWCADGVGKEGTGRERKGRKGKEGTGRKRKGKDGKGRERKGKNKMQPTNPNAHTYVNGGDVETHGYAVTQSTFLQ